MRYIIIISLLINSFNVSSQELNKKFYNKSNKIVNHVDKLGGEVLAIYNRKGHKLYIQRSKNGVTNYVNCGSPASLDSISDELTIEAWIYPTDWGEYSTYGFGRVVDKGGTNTNGFLLYLHNTAASSILNIR